jgi:2-polyprenyl-3-methyl-5-hydroxy-6-metoxy-1,4-benzoquinol methylase
MFCDNIKPLIKAVLKRSRLAGMLTKFILRLHNFSYEKISILSQLLESDKIHPKHRITGYHDWFVKHMDNSWTILDIGCGNGALSFDISKVAKRVIGIDFEENNIKSAKERYKRNNLEFVCEDVTTFIVNFRIDCIVLSNILEHIKDRREFLERLKKISNKFLIRVPMLNRDWITMYKKEMGVRWRLDNTHCIEYTRDIFYEEMKRVGMVIKEQEIMWGEIYAVVEANKYATIQTQINTNLKNEG